MQKFDADGARSMANQVGASGDAKLQTLPSSSLTALSGNYITGLEGISTIATLQAAGVLHADAQGTLTGLMDISASTQPIGLNNSVAGTYTAPDAATGRGMMSFAIGTSAGQSYVYYVVSPSQILLMAQASAAQLSIFSGSAFLQKPGTYDNTSLNGKAVAYENTLSSANSRSTTGSAVALLTSDGAGNLTTDLQANYNGSNSSNFGTPRPHTYTIAANGQLTFPDESYKTLSLWFYDKNQAIGIGAFNGTGVLGQGLIHMQAQQLPAAIQGTFTMKLEPMVIGYSTNTGVATFNNGLVQAVNDRAFGPTKMTGTSSYTTFNVGSDGKIAIAGFAGYVINEGKIVVVSNSTFVEPPNTNVIETVEIFEK